MASRPPSPRSESTSTHHVAQRMTAQRQAVFDVLQSCLDHPTADEVFVRVREALPRVSLATVYRNLDVLAEQGLVNVIEFPGRPRRYDAITEKHYHIVCVKCNSVQDVHLDQLPDLGRMVARTGAFQVLATRLEFEGICESCRRDLAEGSGDALPDEGTDPA